MDTAHDLKCGVTWVNNHPTFTLTTWESLEKVSRIFLFIIAGPSIYFIWKGSFLFRALFGALKGVVNVFPLHQYFQ